MRGFHIKETKIKTRKRQEMIFGVKSENIGRAYVWGKGGMMDEVGCLQT